MSRKILLTLVQQQIDFRPLKRCWLPLLWGLIHELHFPAQRAGVCLPALLLGSVGSDAGRCVCVPRRFIDVFLNILLCNTN